MGDIEAATNETTNTNAQCKVVVYRWVNGLANPEISDDQLSRTTRLDISSQVISCSFSKSMASPAGNFSVELSNSPGIETQDWKDIIKRGDWLLIYMSQDGDLDMNPQVGKASMHASEHGKLRGICYVKRVGGKNSVGEKGEKNATVAVTGVDFGIVYEDTEIWHNLFKYESIMLESIRTSQLNITGNIRVDQAIDLIHDLFYFPANVAGAKVDDNNSLLDIGLQWLMPREMLKDIGFNVSGLTKGTYWGALPGVKNFKKTSCNIAIEHPTDFLSGNAWEELKKLSVPQFHEMFCETTDLGKPQMTFRPIPWAIDKSKYPSAGEHITLYKDLKPLVKVPAVDILEDDVSEDDHSRYNSFLATVSTTLISVENNISLLDGTDFPRHNRASIRRHGFRPMHVTVDSIVSNEKLASGVANRSLLIEYNELLYDYWNNAVFAESGSIQKIGSNDIKIGKALEFNQDVPYLNTRRYYIEGYTDTFSVDEKGGRTWIQEVALTHGLEKRALITKSGFNRRATEFTEPGEYTPGGSEGSGK